MFNFFKNIKKYSSNSKLKNFSLKFFIIPVLLLSIISSLIPIHTSNVAASGSLEPAIVKNLYKNGLATCMAYSPLRDDMSWFSQRNNINESNASNLKWFSDSPTNNTQPLDVFVGAAVRLYGGSAAVDTYGRALCSDPNFIAEALRALGYQPVIGNPDSIYPIMCELGFRRDGGDGCLSGNRSWDRRDLGDGDTARNKVLNSSKLKAIPALSGAEQYWLGYTSFKYLCDATISAPGNANVSDGVISIKEYNNNPDDPKMVDMLARKGTNPKSISGGGLPNDAYTIGIVGTNSTNAPPGSISAGQVIAGSVRFGTIFNGCVEFANSVNNLADDYLKWAILNKDLAQTPTNETGGNTDNGGSNSSQSACVVEGLGWIVCPVLNFTAGIVDAAYGWVSSLLQVKSLVTTGDTQGIYNGWIIMRNIANIAFVIAFLIIIFSQLTGVGVSNYGVKKMLPRIVVAAILVNISFWICAIAVDLSNILGASMNQVFDAIGKSIPAKPNTIDWDSGKAWAGLTGTILAAGVVGTVTYFAGLSALIPALLAAVVAIVTVFLVLTLRQALIVLLIVIAPLAFVAYLLPNTEGWFKSWRKLFMTLLLMYPIIATVFGASALASLIVMNSSNDTIVQIMGGCIAIIPLAITPLILKTAGGLLNRFAGIVNNTEKGPVDRLRKVGQGYRESRTNLRNAQALSGKNQFGRGAFVRWRARRGAVANGRQSEANYAKTEYVADKIQASQSFQNSVAGGSNGLFGVPIGQNLATPEAQQRALANAIGTEAKLRADEISASHVVIKNAQLNKEELRKVSEGLSISKTITSANGKESVLNIDGNSTAVKAAAIKSVVEANDVHQMNKLWDESRNWHDEDGNRLRETFADSLQSSSHRPAYFGQGAIAGLRSSDKEDKHADIQSVIESALKNNAYSADKVAAADKDELAAVDQIRRITKSVTHEEHQRFKENVHKALTDDRINVRISKNRENIEKIEKNIPIPPLT